MQLERENRKIIAQKIFDLGNFAIAALIFGLVVSKQDINIWFVILGVILYLSCLYIGMMLLKRK
ncbi:MAG: hypothetical protein AB1567_04920 [bacterium]